MFLNPHVVERVAAREGRVNTGHIGTHIDLKGKTFTDRELPGVIIRCEDGTEIMDADLSMVTEGCFVMFNTNHSRYYEYGRNDYHEGYATLSDELIEKLIEKKVALIGIDGPGIKSGAAHPQTDQYLADRNIFVVENLCYLSLLEEGTVYDISIRAMDSVNDGLPVEVIVHNY